MKRLFGRGPEIYAEDSLEFSDSSRLSGTWTVATDDTSPVGDVLAALARLLLSLPDEEEVLEEPKKAEAVDSSTKDLPT